MAKEVYKIPDTISLDIIKSLEGSNGTKVNVIEDANGNNVISCEIVNSDEFKEVKNMIELQGHIFTKIDYKPKKYNLEEE